MNTNPETTPDTTAALDKRFAPARPITVGGVMTLSSAVPMTRAQLRALEALWQVETAQAGKGKRRDASR